MNEILIIILIIHNTNGSIYPYYSNISHYVIFHFAFLYYIIIKRLQHCEMFKGRKTKQNKTLYKAIFKKI
jgi:hypothetical protein